MVKKLQHLNAPRPAIGTCQTTGTWKNPNMVNKCLSCVNNLDYYGEKQFFCNNKCTSVYDTNSRCPLNSLVAKNASQCLAPCVQVSPPSLGSCSDNFDCNTNEICSNSNCIADPSTTPPTSSTQESFKERFDDYNYSLDNYVLQTNFYDNNNLFIGVL